MIHSDDEIRSGDEDVLAHLLRRAPIAGAAGPCPDDNLLVGWAEGRLDAERRERIESHLASCDACREAATELRGLQTVEASARAARVPVASAERAIPSLDAARRSQPGSWSLAAAILLSIGAGLAAFSTMGKRGDGTDVDARLVAAARDLREHAPDAFEGFEPASPAERRSQEGEVVRGGVIILEPAGTILATHPRIEWAGGADAEAFDVVLAGPDGAELWRRTVRGAHATDLGGDAPALLRGTAYVVEVTPVGGVDAGRVTRGFRVASAAEIARWTRAEEEVGRRAPKDLSNLVLAHWAARRDLLLAAHALVEDHLAAARDDRVGQETRTWIRRRLGWPDDAAGAAGDAPGR